MSRRNVTGRSSTFVRQSVLALAALAAVPAVSAQAASLTWDNNGNTAPNPQDGTGSWDNVLLNWFDGTNSLAWNNANLDTAVFGAGGAGGAVTVGNVTVGGITLNSAGYTLSGGVITVNGATPITANQTGTITSGIAGAGPITLSVAPAAVLNWESTSMAATGGVLLTGGGTVDLRAAGVLGTTVELNNVTVKFNDARTLSTPFTVSAGNTASITLTANGTLSGALTGGGVYNLSSVGAGTNRVVSLQGNNTAFTGTINIGANAFLRMTTNNGGSANAVYDLGANAGSIGCRVGSGTLQLGALIGSSATSILRGSAGTGTAPAIWEIGGHSSVDSTFMGVIANGDAAARTAGLSKIGVNRTLSLGGVNTYTANTFVNAGTLELLTGASIATSPVIFVHNTGTLNVTNNNFSIGSGQRLSGNNGVIAGNVAIPTGASMNPGDIGTVGTLNFLNNLNLNGGEARFDAGIGTNDIVNITGGLALNSGTVFIAPFGALNPGNYTLATYNSASLTGSTANVNLVFGQRAGGTLDTTSTPGQLKLNIGTVGTSAALNWSGTTTGTWNLSGAQNWFNTNTAAQDAFFSGDTVNFVDGAGLITTIVKSGLLEPAAVAINTNTQAFDIGGSGTISGAITVTKSGSSTVTFSTANAYTNGTTINGGTVVASNGSGLGTGSVLLAAPGAALMMGGGITLANVININADNTVIGGNGTLNAAVNTFNTPISVSVPTTGTTWTLNASAVFTNLGAGPITLTATDSSQGSIRFNGTNTSFGGVDWNLGNSSVTMFNRDSARNIPLGSLSGGPNTLLRGNSNTTVGVTTYTIGGGASNNTTFAGTILDGTVNTNTGTVAIVKGSGSLTLTGNNTYTGTTTVNSGGTLIVNGSHTGGSAYTVNGALGGSGVISAAVSVAGGGTLSPGASVGVLSVGSLALAGGSGVNAEFGTAGGDTVIVTSANGATATATVNVNLSDAGGAIAGQYPLIDFDGAGPVAASFATSGSVGGLTAGLVDNAAGSSVDVVLTGSGPVHSMWNTNANADWTPGGSWTSGSPNGVDFQAYFGSVATGPVAVNVDSAKTVSRMHFNATGSYTLAGSAITLDASSGGAAVNVIRGSHAVSSTLNLSDDTTMTVGTGGALALATVNNNASLLTKNGRGVLSVGTINGLSASVRVNQGTLLVNGQQSFTSGSYSVANGAALGGSGAIVTNNINIEPGGIVAPGASIGTLTVGSISLDNARLAWEIGGGAADQLNINGGGPNLTLTGVSTFTFADLGGITPGTYTLINYVGGALANLSNFAVSNPVLAGFQLSLVNNVGNTSVDLSIGNISSTWNVDANGNWGAAASWTNNVIPNGIDATANFGTIITAGRTVTMNAPQTVGTMNFSSPISYTVGGGSLLTMDVSSGQTAINVTAGTHTISAPVTLNDSLTITSAASTGVAMTGVLTATGQNITKAGAGSAQFANVRANSLSVNEGLVRVAAGGTANLAAGTSVVTSLSIATSGAQLDLTNNSAIVDYTGPVGTLVDDTRQHLLNNRLVSSTATALIGLGYADNAALSPVKTTFAGQSVDDSSLLIKFTYFGDVNLDGQVDVADLGVLATNWQTTQPWSGGDFDYNGTVNVNDLGLLATNWQAGVGSPLGPDFATAVAGLGLPNVAVPEPMSMSMIGALASLALKRQGRRSRR